MVGALTWCTSQELLLPSSRFGTSSQTARRSFVGLGREFASGEERNQARQQADVRSV